MPINRHTKRSHDRLALICSASSPIVNSPYPQSSPPKNNWRPFGRQLHFHSVLLNGNGPPPASQFTTSKPSHSIPILLSLPFRRLPLRVFLEAEGGDLVGVVAELGADLVLDALDAFVAFVLEEDGVVAGGGVAVGSVEFAFAGGGYAGLEFGEGGEGVGGLLGA